MTRKNNITQRSKVKRGEEFLVWSSNWETESQLSMRKVEEMKNTCADNGWKALLLQGGHVQKDTKNGIC